MGRIIKKLIIVSLSVCLILQTYNIVCMFVHRMKYKDYEYCGTEPLRVQCPYSKAEIKSKIEDIVGEHFYIYKKVNKTTKVYVPLRIVFINENYSDMEYTKSLAHELTHLKHQTRNERYTTYKTIISLYGSGDAYFRYVALDYANEVWGGRFNGNEYDCGAYLVDYFRNNGQII